jgi:signal peptidase II
MEDERKSFRPLIFAFVAILALVLVDQWSKAAVFEWLLPAPADISVDRHGHRRYELAGEWFAFMTTTNKGAAFGQFGGFPHVLVGGRILAVGLLLWLLWRSNPKQRLVFIAMTLVLAGAIGNLIDNLWTGGIEEDHPYLGVRDFIDVWFLPLGWDYHFPSFNVADSCISVGAVLWILSGLFHPKEPEPEDGSAEEPVGVS